MKEGGGRPRTKVVVRMLPANLTSEAFWKLVEEKVADKVEWWYYCLGKARCALILIRCLLHPINVLCVAKRTMFTPKHILTSKVLILCMILRISSTVTPLLMPKVGWDGITIEFTVL